MIKSMKNKPPVWFSLVCVIAVFNSAIYMWAFVLAANIIPEPIAFFWKHDSKDYAMDLLGMIISSGVFATLYLLGSVLLMLKKPSAFKVHVCALVAFFVQNVFLTQMMGIEVSSILVGSPAVYFLAFLVYMSYYANKRKWLA